MRLYDTAAVHQNIYLLLFNRKRWLIYSTEPYVSSSCFHTAILIGDWRQKKSDDRMPDSEAVYQPTTVGYTYEHGGDGNEVNGVPGMRSGFSRIIFRHKVSTRKWLEWVLLSVALCATVAGLTTILVNLLTSGDAPVIASGNQDAKTGADNMGDKIEDPSKSSLAVGFSITLLGMFIGALWVWLRFFRRSGKSQRGGMSRASGQYGPVLTEVPSQMTVKQIVSDSRTIPMSDQEEETHTLMQDPTSVPTPISQGHETVNNQIAA